ncbi:hypothetical protein [Lentzea sp. NPDC059081]|uniref:hypothetical protein n=1 Tax=Lentzea sp. NPDC059081 TaxID=3346719 RepID=UPI003690829C
MGANVAPPSVQAETTLHEHPEDIAAHGFDRPYNTAVFDFILKTHSSPDVAFTVRSNQRHDVRRPRSTEGTMR